MDAKEAILHMLAECAINVEHDADMTTTGTYIDQSRFTIEGPLSALETLVEALGIPRDRQYESVRDALFAAMENDR